METRAPTIRAVGVLTTMHGKHEAIAPILRRELGVVVGVTHGVDTSQFGDLGKTNLGVAEQLEIARAKVKAGFAYAPLARYGLASVASFRRHPQVPTLAVARELVLMIDRLDGREVFGCDCTTETNYAEARASSLEEALAFAQRIGFPRHGLAIQEPPKGVHGPRLTPVSDACSLTWEINVRLSRAGVVRLMSDMRAHRNPTRMVSIQRAASHMAERAGLTCPNRLEQAFQDDNTV